MSPPASPPCATRPLDRALAGLFAPAVSVHAPLAATMAAPIGAPARAKKLWELASQHHCPLVGTCLSHEELVNLACRFGFVDDLDDEHALHVRAASLAGSRNEVSVALHKQLDRKYAAALARFDGARSDADVLALWRQCSDAGDIAGPLWAALTHKASSDATRQRIYGEMHMRAHRLGAGQAADTRRLAHLRAEHQQLRERAERERLAHAQRADEWRAQWRAAQDRIQDLQAQVDAQAGLRVRLAAFESGTAQARAQQAQQDLGAAQAQIAAHAARQSELEDRAAALSAELAALRQKHEQATQECAALERLLSTADDDTPDAVAPCLDDCPIDGRRAARNVLCVGGRTALLAQYRALAERLGLRLLHHDGGLEETVSRLPDMINGADAVICPTDCVSHSAYYRLKQHCKRSGKPCLLFKGAGVSSMALALTRVASDPANLSLAAVT